MDVRGTWGYAAGTSGTVIVPAGATVLQIVVHATAASATATIFNGASVPVIAGANPVTITFPHGLLAAGNNTAVAGSQNIVFTGTDQFFVEYCKAGYV